ncbi:MAG: 2-C-methyl-D-erythritol 4-phosphate cytidylyltransferase [Bacteroidia bacterium]|nr:2-C-methyl-D-erythritol 4-phosphate cytidylyltransferase [Bacteroidia bacterium]
MFGVIVVAGGIGTRMGSQIPKQFIDINGLPILAHTLTKILMYPGVSNLWLVLPQDWAEYWDKLVQQKQLQWRIPINIIFGGKTRTESVWNALKSIQNSNLDLQWIAIHDACRPLINNTLIESILQIAKLKGGAVPAIPVKSSLRKITQNGSIACNRDEYYEVQTPQIFSFNYLIEAYQNLHNQPFTDDASLFEAAGFSVSIAQGAFDNIKITTEEDLFTAQKILDKLSNS